MDRRDRISKGFFVAAVLAACALAVFAPAASAQETPIPTPSDTLAAQVDDTYANLTAGEFTPAKGFDLVKTSRGSLNISVYGMFRYLNQTPADQTYTDHLGRERDRAGAQRPQLAPPDALGLRLRPDPAAALLHHLLVADRRRSSPWASATSCTRSTRTSPSASAWRPISPAVRCRGRIPSGPRATARWPRSSSAAASRPACSFAASRSRVCTTRPRSTRTSASSASPPPTTPATWPTAAA